MRSYEVSSVDDELDMMMPSAAVPEEGSSVGDSAV